MSEKEKMKWESPKLVLLNGDDGKHVAYGAACKQPGSVPTNLCKPVGNGAVNCSDGTAPAG
ncbi:hypothetical protein ACFLU6_09345 [Acidobacteriota bacterium]